MHRTFVTALALCALATPALANDSSAEIGIGGLILTKNDAISMDAEDLFLSEQEVRVRYRFTNRSNRDVETLVSFPVPDLPGGVPDYLGDRSVPDYRELKFQTTIDGKPVKLDYVERAELAGGRDVTARLKQLGWPMGWSQITYEQGPTFIDKLSEPQKAAFIREGLLRKWDDYGLLPAWNLVTHVTRKQVFPAGKTVEVTHRYVPMAGGSVGGGLDPEFRGEGDYFKEKVAKYCIDKPFLAGFDRRLGTKPVGERPIYMEHWLSYILKSGSNWRGPIGNFRLVVDKGRPDNLVSFCMDGVKKISPTQFEVRKQGFEPKRDIDLLIISWGLPE